MTPEHVGHEPTVPTETAAETGLGMVARRAKSSVTAAFPVSLSHGTRGHLTVVHAQLDTVALPGGPNPSLNPATTQ